MTDEQAPREFKPEHFQLIPAGTRQEACRGCQAPIYWAKNSKGKMHPFDCDVPGGTRPGNGLTDHGRGVTHFATCPNADRFRKRRGDG